MAIKDYVKGTIKDKEIENTIKMKQVILKLSYLIKTKVTNEMSEEEKKQKNKKH